MPVCDGFEMNGAFRYSDYSLPNVSGVWTYGGGATWQIIPEVMIRGEYQRAVRAPSVDELFRSNSTISVAAAGACALPTATTPGPICDLFLDTGVRSEEHTSELQSLMRN